MFDIDTLASMSGLIPADVRTFLPSILNAVRDYTNRSFITSISISDNIIIKNGKIIVSNDIPSEFIPESQIELRYSINNTKIYTIKSINKNEIEVYEKLFDEEFDGFIIKLSFTNINDDIISSMLNYKKSVIKYSAVKSESLDGYNYILNVDSSNVKNSYPTNIMSGLNSLRQLPDKKEVEYYERGFIK